MPAPRWVRALRLVSYVGLLAIVPGLMASKVKGQVQGHDRLLNPVWVESAKPSNHRYTWREPSPTVRKELRELFGLAPKELCIAGLSSQDVKPPQVPTLISIGGSRTTPVTIVVAPGTRLRFRNTDPFKHNIYGVEDKSGLTPSVMNPSAEREWTAPGEGTFEIRDKLAPSLRSWVVVKKGVASIGYPGRDGAFSLTLEPGEYTLQPYFAGHPIGSPRAITVGKNDLDISKQPIPVASGSSGATPGK